MMKYIIFALVSIIVFSNIACKVKSKSSKKASDTAFWVAGWTAPCAPEAETACYWVQAATAAVPDWDTQQWHTLNEKIEGLNFSFGTFYKINTKRTKNEEGKEQYILEKIIEQKNDPRVHLNDIWALESMEGGTPLSVGKGSKPTLEIHLSDNRIGGYDGCNNFFGELQRLSPEGEIQFGKMGGTLRACMDGNSTDRIFYANMEQVRYYAHKNLQLILYDADKKEKLRFKKVD